jgi:hypothetical protein
MGSQPGLLAVPINPAVMVFRTIRSSCQSAETTATEPFVPTMADKLLFHDTCPSL